jgi:hypothetical protein
MAYVTAHHDEGWAAVDAAPKHDPRTGLPYHLTQTPMPDLLRTGAGSPDFNQRRHPFCGLLSSMHTYGLYHGRYGLSDKIVINMVPTEYRADAQRMLQGELARQAALKEQLRSHPETAEWASDAYVLSPYPFAESGMTFWCEGRYLLPRAEETDWGAVMRQTPCERETVTLIAG